MKSEYKNFAEKYHKLTPRPTTLMEDKDVASLQLFVEQIQSANGNDWADGDEYFGVTNAN